jgi:hypothetical protein
MEGKLRCRDKAEVSIELSKSSRSGVKLRGNFHVECFKPDGSLAWVEDVSNIITDEGLNRILGVVFAGVTQTATWYVGLVKTDTAPAAGMTYAVPVFTECVVADYTENARQAYVETVTTTTCTNSVSKAVFTMETSITLYGAFLASVVTADDRTGGANNVLMCYARFGAGQAVQAAYVVNVTYTITAADDGV